MQNTHRLRPQSPVGGCTAAVGIADIAGTVGSGDCRSDAAAASFGDGGFVAVAAMRLANVTESADSCDCLTLYRHWQHRS